MGVCEAAKRPACLGPISFRALWPQRVRRGLLCRRLSTRIVGRVRAFFPLSHAGRTRRRIRVGCGRARLFPSGSHRRNALDAVRGLSWLR